MRESTLLLLQGLRSRASVSGPHPEPGLWPAGVACPAERTRDLAKAAGKRGGNGARGAMLTPVWEEGCSKYKLFTQAMRCSSPVWGREQERERVGESKNAREGERARTGEKGRDRKERGGIRRRGGDGGEEGTGDTARFGKENLTKQRRAGDHVQAAQADGGRVPDFPRPLALMSITPPICFYG